MSRPDTPTGTRLRKFPRPVRTSVTLTDMKAPTRFDRKIFLTYALGSTATLVIGCSDDPVGPGGSAGSAGSGGTPGGGTGGSGGSAGSSAGSFSTSGSGGTAGGSGGTTGGGGTGGSSGGAGGSGGAPAPDCGTKLQTFISSNHMHVFEVTVADVMAGVDKIYDTTGGSTHPHWVKLTAADFTTLKNGGTVYKYTCNDEHEHEYIVNCLGNANPVTKGGVAQLCEPHRDCAETMTDLCPEFP